MPRRVLGYSEITLLSNDAVAHSYEIRVLGYSEITLLSNGVESKFWNLTGFRLL